MRRHPHNFIFVESDRRFLEQRIADLCEKGYHEEAKELQEALDDLGPNMEDY